jgi:hypothetical protein
MADEDASLDIVIRTRAELEGAESAEAQLDRDIGKARELGQEYAAQEAQAGRARDARESGQEPKPGPQGEMADMPEVESAREASATDPDEPERSEVETPQAENVGKQPGGEAIVATGGDVKSRELEPTSTGEREAETTDAQDEEQPSGVSEAVPIFAPRDGAIPGPEFDMAGGRMAESQAQGIQAAGERMRAALEQNGQMTVAVLNRTLELIEQQNRKLEEVERRVEQLGGRIKSLKNP